MRYCINDPERNFETEGKHEAIITEDLYNAAQILIKKNARTAPTKKPTEQNYFVNLLYCECGEKYYTHSTIYETKKGKSTNYSFQCRKRNVNAGCYSKTFTAGKVERALIEYFSTYEDVFLTDSNAIFRGAVDTIARHTAKLKPYTKPTIQRLDRVLQIEPNPYISAYDLLYKATTAYFCDNNAFILIHRDESENVSALYNLTPASVEFFQAENATGGALYCKFLFKSGENVIIPYSDIIHLRRHFAKNELLGTDNSALFPAYTV